MTPQLKTWTQRILINEGKAELASCSALFKMVQEKVRTICQQFRRMVDQSFEWLVQEEGQLCGVEERDNFLLSLLQVGGSAESSKMKRINLPLARIYITAYSHLTNCTKELQAFWKVLYDCSQVKDLPYATLENALNELILDIFVQPTPQFKPKKFLPTLPFTYKCKFIHSSPEGIAKREALTRFYEDEEMRKRIAERKMGNRLE